jgi:hypothetical protein
MCIYILVKANSIGQNKFTRTQLLIALVDHNATVWMAMISRRERGKKKDHNATEGFVSWFFSPEERKKERSSRTSRACPAPATLSK